MTDRETTTAAPKGDAARLWDHAVPVFDGAQSHRHARRKVWRLQAEAIRLSLARRGALNGASNLVQFAGWPRSGHSLIGALIDAHPNAAIAHELDAMGLFHKGVSVRRLMALCLGNAADFTAAGRHWNGFQYAVPGASHGPSGSLTVIGDKKGDWATRWCGARPSLISELSTGSPVDCRWILVTRHPADNIATMALRRGGAYDRLRMSAEDDMSGAIRAAQADGRIASETSDAMIADYRALAASVAGMKSRVPADRWIEIVYEDFVTAPRAGLERLATFLGIDPDPVWCAAAAGIVRPSTGHSRDRLSWRADQLAEIRKMIDTHDFLSVYRTDV